MKKLFKPLVILIIFSLIMTFVPGNLPNAVEANQKIATPQNNTDKIELVFKDNLKAPGLKKVIQDELDDQTSDSLKLSKVTINGDNLSGKVSSELDDTKVTLNADTKTNSTTLHTETFRDEDLEKRNYDIIIKEVKSKDNYTLVFVDQTTGELKEYKYNQATAAIIPYVVYFIGAMALRATFSVVKKQITKKVAGKVVTTTKKVRQLTVKGKTYQEKSASASIKATATFKTFSVKVGQGQTVKLQKERMQHILQRHHLTYWTGQTKQKNDFFDPSLTPNDIRAAIAKVVQKNKSTISNKMKTHTANKPFVVKAKYHGYNYAVEITKSGKIVTAYPNK